MMNKFKEQSVKGRCLCGGVQFEVRGELDGVIVCHCVQCRKITGHVMAATRVQSADNLIITKQETLAWYHSSSLAKRGFCNVCGATIFWKSHHKEGYSIAMGTLDNPPQLSIKSHIFCQYKGNYYDIKDDVPQYDET